MRPVLPRSCIWFIFLLLLAVPLPVVAWAEPDLVAPASPADFSCDSVTEIPAAECEALVRYKAPTAIDG